MSDEAKSESATRYLMFKAALLSGDSSLATECLRAMIQTEPNVDHILACVHAAREANSKLVTLEAAQAVLKCYDQGLADSSKVPLPTLIRCSIRLLEGLSRETANAENLDDFAGRMVELFEDGGLDKSTPAGC